MTAETNVKGRACVFIDAAGDIGAIAFDFGAERSEIVRFTNPPYRSVRSLDPAAARRLVAERAGGTGKP